MENRNFGKAFVYTVLVSIALNLNLDVLTVKELESSAGIEHMHKWFRMLWDLRLSLSGYSVERLLFSILLFCFFVKALSYVDKTKSKIAVFPALLLAFFQVFGESFKKTSSFELIIKSGRSIMKSGIKYAGLYILFFFVIKMFLVIMENMNSTSHDQKERNWFSSNKKSLFIVTLLILIMWLPYAISYFPGLTNYDFFDMLDTFYGNDTNSIRAVVQISEDVTLNNNNPVLQTMIAVGVMKLGNILGSPYIGIFMFCYGQMIVFALILSYSLTFLSKLGVSEKVRFILLMFYGLLPWHANFALTTLKDTNFSFVMLLYVIMIIELVMDDRAFLDDKKKLALLAAVNLLLMLLRNNGSYVLLVVDVILLIVYHKSWKKMIIPTILPAFIYMVLITHMLYPALKISPGSRAEMYSLPLQQIARLAKEFPDAVEKEDIDIIKKVLPKYDEFADRYQPEIADPIKSTFNKYSTSDEMNAFVKVWFKYLLKYPTVYIEAAICDCFGYFYPEAEHWLVYTEISPPGLNYGVHSPEKLSVWRKEMNQMSYIVKFIPGFGMLMSVGFYTWIIIFSSIWIVYKKAFKYLIIWSPLVLLVMTVLLGPVNTMPRYVYPVIISAPVVFAAIACLIRRETRE